MSDLKQERRDQPMEFDQYLGQQDMELHPLWSEAWFGQDQQKFEQILHEMGADLKYGYEFNVCLHRARTNNKVEYGVRVSFKERTDKWWMNNMMCVQDIIRNTHCSIRATGMRESMNEESSALVEVMRGMASQSVVNVDIPVDMGEEDK